MTNSRKLLGMWSAGLAAGVAFAVVPSAAGAATQALVGDPLPADQAAWKMGFDCTTDTVQVRAVNPTSGHFVLTDLNDKVVRQVTVAKNGPAAVSWDVPFSELLARPGNVDHSDEVPITWLSLKREYSKPAHHGESMLSFFDFRVDQPCRAAKEDPSSGSMTSARSKLKGTIPDTVVSGKRYRLPSKAVMTAPFSQKVDRVYYTAFPLSGKAIGCRVEARGKRHWLVGLKPGRQCLLEALTFQGGYSAGSGPVAIVSVKR